MNWVVRLSPDFLAELHSLPDAVQLELLAQAKVIERFGPGAGRPRIDTLKGSRYPNMKELRFDAANRTWRVAFAFDSHREAVLLAVGSKSGIAEDRFYRQLIVRADHRFAIHQAQQRTPPTRH